MIAADDPRHGTRRGYEVGCRETCCTKPQTRWRKRYLLRRLRMGGSTTVDAGRAARAIAELHERMSYSAIARALDTSHSYISALHRGDVKRIDPAREARILLLSGYQPTDSSHINPIGAQRRIQALRALGYSFSRLVRETGYSDTSLKKLAHDPWPVIEAKNDQAIRAAYDRLSMTIPTSDNRYERSGITRARILARREGWAPPLAWNEGDIDDPNARPHIGSSKVTVDYDEAVVLRRVDSGEKIRKLTPAEAAEVERRLRLKGYSSNEIEKDYGIKSERYHRRTA